MTAKAGLKTVQTLNSQSFTIEYDGVPVRRVSSVWSEQRLLAKLHDAELAPAMLMDNHWSIQGLTLQTGSTACATVPQKCMRGHQQGLTSK